MMMLIEPILVGGQGAKLEVRSMSKKSSSEQGGERQAAIEGSQGLSHFGVGVIVPVPIAFKSEWWYF
jgi:hypothetical protein